MKCDKCRRTIRRREVYYSFDRFSNQGVFEKLTSDIGMFCLCKKCNLKLVEWLEGDKNDL